MSTSIQVVEDFEFIAFFERNAEAIRGIVVVPSDTDDFCFYIQSTPEYQWSRQDFFLGEG